MIEIDDKIVSADLLREYFACDLGTARVSAAWKATRAPLEAEEVDILEREYETTGPI